MKKILPLAVIAALSVTLLASCTSDTGTVTTNSVTPVTSISQSTKKAPPSAIVSSNSDFDKWRDQYSNTLTEYNMAMANPEANPQTLKAAEKQFVKSLEKLFDNEKKINRKKLNDDQKKYLDDSIDAAAGFHKQLKDK